MSGTNALLLLTLLAGSPQELDPEIRALIRELGSEETSVRRRASAALEARGKAAVPALARLFEDERKGLLYRLRAGGILHRLDSTASTAIPVLHKRLRDSDPCIRRRAAFVLARVDPNVVEALVALLDHTDRAVSDDAVLALRRRGEASVALLVREAKTGTLERSRRAVRVLGLLAPLSRSALIPLIPILKNRDPVLRRNAAWALGEFGDAARTAEPALTKALEDPDVAVRRSAAASLSRIIPSRTETLDALARALKDPDVHVRRTSAGALLRMGGGGRSALVAFRKAAQSPDPIVAETAAEAVRRMDPEGKPPPDPPERGPEAPYASSPYFYLRTMNHLRAHVFLNGRLSGETTYSWSLNSGTKFDPLIPVGARLPREATSCGFARGPGAIVSLGIAEGVPEKHRHLVTGEHVLFVDGMVGGIVRIGAVRLRVVGEDGSLYRHLLWDPVMGGEEDPNAFRFLRTLWFEQIPED